MDRCVIETFPEAGSENAVCESLLSAARVELVLLHPVRARLNHRQYSLVSTLSRLTVWANRKKIESQRASRRDGNFARNAQQSSAGVRSIAYKGDGVLAYASTFFVVGCLVFPRTSTRKHSQLVAEATARRVQLIIYICCLACIRLVA